MMNSLEKQKNKKGCKKKREKKKQLRHLLKMLIKLDKIIRLQVKLKVKRMYMIGWNGLKMFVSKDWFLIMMIIWLDIDSLKYWFNKIKVQNLPKSISKVYKKQIKIL